MFLTGPAVVKEVMGEDVDAATLGGPKVHDRNGVCQLGAATDLEAVWLVRDLLGYLPQHAAEPRAACPCAPPTARRASRARAKRRVYDVRDVVPRSSTAATCWRSARAGRATCSPASPASTAARSASSPTSRATSAACSTPHAATKGARFVRTCDLYGIPLVVLVDTPGFLPGTSQEKLGVIRHGAKLVHAFAAATVPRVTVVLRKALRRRVHRHEQP